MALALAVGGLVGLQTGPSYAAPITPAPTPVLTGEPKAGNNIFINAGEWPEGTALSYEWLLDGVKEPGASGPAWTLRQQDIDVAFQVAVTGSKQGFDDTRAVSAPVTILGEQQTLRPVPTVAGTPRYGDRLDATIGAWDIGTTQAIQWLRGGTPILGATAASYTATVADVDAALSVRVTSTRPGYSKVVRTSEPTAPVVPATMVAGSVTVTGAPRFGQSLSARPSGWPADAALAYQWLRRGTPVAGATASSYRLGLADLGAPLSVRVTASKPGFTVASAASAATAAVAPATFAAGKVRIVGKPKAGRTLRARASGLPAGTAVAYRWRVGSKVVGTKASLKLTRKMVGKRVVLQATATKAGYRTLTLQAKAPTKTKK